MNLDTVTMDPAEAQAKADEYRTIRTPSDEDQRIIAIFTALAAGKQVVDWDKAIRDAGLNELGLPKLAIGESKDQWCYLNMQRSVYRAGQHIGYSEAHYCWSQRARNAFIVTDMEPMIFRGNLRTQTPMVPPACRVRGWRSMLILWEVEEWAKAPRPPGDPILLKPLLGTLATVEAIWDLTEVERLVLGQRP